MYTPQICNVLYFLIKIAFPLNLVVCVLIWKEVWTVQNRSGCMLRERGYRSVPCLDLD